MKPTKFWVMLLSALLLLSAGTAFYVSSRLPGGSVANVYQDGVCIHSVDLSQVAQAYSLVVSGSFENTVVVERGRICVAEASCPDQVCVHQGWISDGVVPVVCLPNRLVVRIGSESGGGADAVSR